MNQRADVPSKNFPILKSKNYSGDFERNLLFDAIYEALSPEIKF